MAFEISKTREVFGRTLFTPTTLFLVTAFQSLETAFHSARLKLHLERSVKTVVTKSLEVRPALPAGLQLHPETGVIHGVPQERVLPKTCRQGNGARCS